MSWAELLAWPAVTFAFSLTFFPALRLQLKYILAFPVSFSHLALVFLAIALALTGLVLLLGRLGDARWRKILALTLMSLSFIAWIKGNILIWNYSKFDGHDVDWTAYRVEGLTDVAFCLAVALLAVFKREWLILNRNAICAFIFLAQILYLVWLSPLVSNTSFSDLLAAETVSIKPKTTEILSRKQNLVLIVLDAFQSDIFAELIDARPTIASGLTGFTYFYNTASLSPYTLISLPSIFTGVDYQNQAPYYRYLYQSYRGPTSILARLMQEGYHVEVERWGAATPIPYLSGLASNFVHNRIPSTSTVEDLALLAFYSVLPQFGKRILHQQVSETLIDGHGARDTSMSFIINLSKLGVELIDQPVAKIFHLKGAHVPLRRYDRYGFDYFAAAADPDATSTDVETSRDNYKAVAVQSLLAVNAYLDKLRQAKAYDNATIFVLGDHGAGLQGQDFVLPAGWPVKSPSDVIAGDLQTAAIPLLLVKRAAAGGSMVRSAAPASLADINCTVFRELGVNQEARCLSLFDSDLASRPSRRFLWAEISFDSAGYLPELKEFQIKGPVWAESSWTQSGRIFAAGGVVRPAYATYRLGETIRFGSGGNAALYQMYGWGEPGAGFTWTIGHRASMVMPVVASGTETLLLEASLSPFVVAGKLERQLIDVYANGEKVAQWNATDTGVFKAVIPTRLIAGGIVNLRFDLPEATSPAELGLNDDRAVLGMQLGTVTLHKLAYNPGETIRFGSGGNAALYQMYGWGEPGAGFTWTIGHRASMVMPVVASGTETLLLEASLSPFVVAGKLERQLIDVYANGEKVAQWNATDTGVFKAVIPTRLIAGGIVNLRFDLPEATSPAELGLNDDRAVLGMQLGTVTLHKLAN